MTGLGTTTLQRIKNELSEGKWPESVNDKRGNWSRLAAYGDFDHNQLLEKVSSLK